MEIHAKEMLDTRDRLNQILASTPARPSRRSSTDTDRDNFMDCQEAVDYGLIDRVLEKRGSSVAGALV